MKIIKTYENYNSKNQIPDLGRFSDKINKKLISLNKYGTYDYKGDLDFHLMGLNSLLEIPIQFYKVTGSFYCYQNNLRDLEGAPRIVTKSFSCWDNKLNTLKFSPFKVGLNFYCYDNKLTSLEGSPEEVGKWFNCNGNNLITLKGATKKVEDFRCIKNNLISLQYAPETVNGNFICSQNNLLSKKHFSYITGDKGTIDLNPFEITDGAIETVKKMSIEQRVSELKFFEENDQDAYDMMLQILNENNLGYGKEAQEMIGRLNKDFTNAKEMF